MSRNVTTSLLVTLFAAFTMVVAGFAWFVTDARSVPGDPPVCDGIVALTGGEARIETSLTLLRGGYGQLLLISGVGPRVTLHHLVTTHAIDATSDLEARITLGHRAISTIGNAHEAADWAHMHDLHRLLIVTAGYHMRRALLEIHRTAPTLTLVPYPVTPRALSAPLSRTTLPIFAREYIKFLGAELGYLTGLPDGRDGLTTR